MQLDISYDAQSMLDQLPAMDRGEAMHSLHQLVGDWKSALSNGRLQRLAAGAMGDVYVVRVGAGWRLYLKVSGEVIHLVDVISDRQLTSLRRHS